MGRLSLAESRQGARAARMVSNSTWLGLELGLGLGSGLGLGLAR